MRSFGLENLSFSAPAHSQVFCRALNSPHCASARRLLGAMSTRRAPQCGQLASRYGAPPHTACTALHTRSWEATSRKAPAFSETPVCHVRARAGHARAHFVHARQIFHGGGICSRREAELHGLGERVRVRVVVHPVLIHAPFLPVRMARRARWPRLRMASELVNTEFLSQRIRPPLALCCSDLAGSPVGGACSECEPRLGLAVTAIAAIATFDAWPALCVPRHQPADRAEHCQCR